MEELWKSVCSSWIFLAIVSIAIVGLIAIIYEIIDIHVRKNRTVSFMTKMKPFIDFIENQRTQYLNIFEFPQDTIDYLMSNEYIASEDFQENELNYRIVTNLSNIFKYNKNRLINIEDVKACTIKLNYMKLQSDSLYKKRLNTLYAKLFIPLAKIYHGFYFLLDWLLCHTVKIIKPDVEIKKGVLSLISVLAEISSIISLIFLIVDKMN